MMRQSEEPRISVCLTHYNRAHLLGRTLSSLAEQSRAPDEVFVWDDHSPMDPTSVVGEFAHRFRKFEFHRNEQNLGMPGNLNAVLARATGDYIANLHDADVFHPRLLEAWSDALTKNDSAGLVFCGTSENTEIPGGKVHLHDIAPLTGGADFFVRRYVGSLSGPIWGTVMARRATYESIGPFDSRFGPWADVDMWMRICGQFDIAYVREPLITLNMGVTPLRVFTWHRILLHNQMVVDNINRIFKNRPGDRLLMLRRQRRFLRARFPRLFAGRFVRHDLKQIRDGFRLIPSIFLAPYAREIAVPAISTR